MEYTRYGIYYTPEHGSFATTGAAWLGWDAENGRNVGIPDEAITGRPRKYGFHGTIKPPFHLAEGTDFEGLLEAFNALCGSLAPVTLDGLRLARIGSFLAFVPEGDSAELAQLAGRVVQDLDAFRAPPSEAELARRRQAKLSPLQEENLIQWGYPYVFDAFKFHMTLTGPLPKGRTETVMEQVQQRFEGIVPAPFVVNSLTLVGEGSDGMFYALHRRALAGK